MLSPKQFVAALSLPFLVLYPVSQAGAQSKYVYAKDRPRFTASCTNLSTIDFESIAPSKGVARYSCDNELTIGRLRFCTSDGGKFGAGTLYVASPAYIAQDSVFNTETGAVLIWVPPSRPGNSCLEITLPSGVTAVSADVWTGQPDMSTVDVSATTSDGQTRNSVVTTEPRPDCAFVSFVSDEEITTLRFQLTEGQSYLILDNLSYGQTKTAKPSRPLISVAGPQSRNLTLLQSSPPVESLSLALSLIEWNLLRKR